MSITNSFVDVNPSGTTQVDTVDIVNGGDTNKRQVVALGSPDGGGLTTIAAVQSTMPVGTEIGLVVRDASASDVTTSISITSNAATASVALSGRKSASVVITGTWVGTFVFEASIDGTNWVAVDVYNEVSEAWIQSTTANGSWWFEPLGAVNAVRVRTTAWTSGTATGTLLASMADMNTPEYAGGLGAAVPNNAVYLGGTDGSLLRAIATDSTGHLATKRIPDATSTFSPTNVDSTALETSHVLKASAGVLYGVTGYNSRTTSQFIQIFNSTTVPADTTVPIVTFVVPGSSNFSYEPPGAMGKFFSTGIAISNSSTAATKTIGSADCWFNALIS